jgi:hypothetical protein
MKLNNQQRSILEKLRFAFENKKGNDEDVYKTTALGIKIIESYNRKCLWRLIEYIAFIIEYTFYPIRKYIDNKSIGIYQAKISMILEYLNIPYSIDVRKVKLNDRSIHDFVRIFKNRNNDNVIIKVMKKNEFDFNNNGEISHTKLKYFIEEYSRTTPTDNGFTYYFVFSTITAMHFCMEQFCD